MKFLTRLDRQLNGMQVRMDTQKRCATREYGDNDFDSYPIKKPVLKGGFGKDHRHNWSENRHRKQGLKADAD